MMDKNKKQTFFKEGVRDMPTFTWTDDSVTMTGKAFPENAAQAWVSFINRLKEFFANEKATLKRKTFTVNFILDYYNSSSSLFISTMFKILQDNWLKRDCIVNWHYFEADDEGSGEDGETYRDSNLYKKVTINLIPRKD